MEKLRPMLHSPKTPHNLPSIQSNKHDKENGKQAQLPLDRKLAGDRVHQPQRIKFTRKKTDRRGSTTKIKTQEKDTPGSINPFSMGPDQQNFPTLPSRECSSNRTKKIPPLKTSHPSTSYQKNSIHLYSPTKALPTSNRKRRIQPQTIVRKSEQNSEILLVDFGIFNQEKGKQMFLRRFRQVLQHEFMGIVDLENDADLLRLEFCLLREIHNQGKWIE